MVYIVVQILINTLALALTVWIIPGLSLQLLPQDTIYTILEILLIGIVFGLVNTIIRPLILILTGKLLLKSIGLLAFVMNSLVFYLLVALTDIINSNDLVAIIIGGLLVGFIVAVLEAVLGLDTPIGYGSQNNLRFYWKWIGMLPSGLRSHLVENLRLQQSYSIIWRYGTGIALDQTPLRGLRRRMQQWVYPHAQATVYENPQTAVRLMLQELGPSYVKIGQMVATRSDMLPESFIAELEKLQNDVAPFPYSQVEERIKKELGNTPENIFATFDKEPLAAASTAQIHRATLPDGQRVVVKIERPDINITVRGDLSIMQDIVAKLERRSRRVRDFGMGALLAEFSENVLKELDYRNEAFNAELLSYNMRSMEDVVVPKIYEGYSTDTVLTMEFIEGIKITDLAQQDNLHEVRENMARLFLKAMSQQVIMDGFFHADPHPGNIFVNPQTGKIIFLDVGMMGRLNSKERAMILNLVWVLNEADAKNTADIILQMTEQSVEINQREFEADVDRIVKRYLVFTDEIPLLGDVMQEVFAMLAKHNLRLDRSFTLAMKALVQTEATTTLLAPHTSFFDMAVDEIKVMFMAQMQTDVLVEKFVDKTRNLTSDIALHFPIWQEAASKWMRQLEKGQFPLKIDATDVNQEMEDLKRNLSTNIRRLIIALILMGILVSFAITSNSPVIGQLPTEVALVILSPLVFMGFITVLYLAYILWDSWKSRKK